MRGHNANRLDIADDLDRCAEEIDQALSPLTCAATVRAGIIVNDAELIDGIDPAYGDGAQP